MTTIPASSLVSINPSVLAAGGTALDLSGLIITKNTRVPIGTVQSFSLTPGAPTVSAYFGSGTNEATIAGIYSNGFDGSNVKPGAILFVQYPATAVAAYMRGGNVSGLTLVQLQALSGSLTVVVDSYSHTNAAISLSSASSFSTAASTISSALSNPTICTGVSGSIGAGVASFTGSISGNVLSVSSVSAGTIIAGGLLNGTGITANTLITGQLSGVTGGAGTYAVSNSQVVASEGMTETYGILNVTAVVSGTLAVGQQLAAGTAVGLAANTNITQLGSGSGSVGTYYLNNTQTIGANTFTSTAVAPTVTYDSVSGAFIITSGVTGVASTVAYATGTLAAGLAWTLATGATLSQGSNPQTPAAFMNQVINITDNWATFMTNFDPDGGTGGGNTQKQAFAAWKNTQNNNFGYVCWDTDITPTQSAPAANSLGQILAANGDSGTCLIYEPSDLNMAAFICGAAASIDFTQVGGRITFAYKWQAGLVAGVTDPTTASNLNANNYNYGGVYATANENFTFFQTGVCTGAFKWFDAYINQVWLNNNLQLDLVVLLQQSKSIPYNPAGAALIEAALMNTINQGLAFGMFAGGSTLSSTQIAEVNAQAGNNNIATTLANRGWYLQVLPATAAVRAARGSPPITFWYVDTGSVQKINVASIAVQ